MDRKLTRKPAVMAEQHILEGILSGRFAIDGLLPGERELAALIGVTRPTLREALQRLARDGWLDIQHGKPTRIRDYWQEGSLAVLSVLAQSPGHLSPNFIENLLSLRVLIAPAYTRQAVQCGPEGIISFLENYQSLADIPEVFARADWDLHSLLVHLTPNPVFRLLLNDFHNLYLIVGGIYFSSPDCRSHSQGFYRNLLDCVLRHADLEAEYLTRRIMEESLVYARKMGKEGV